MWQACILIYSSTASARKWEATVAEYPDARDWIKAHGNTSKTYETVRGWRYVAS